VQPVQQPWQFTQAAVPAEGSGANRVLLYFADAAEQRHWMTDRLLRRSGLQREAFRLVAMDTVGPLDLPEFVRREGLQVVVPMGGLPLKQLLNVPPGDLLRWFLRVVPFGWATIVPCLAPSMLLPFQGAQVGPDDLVDDLLNEAEERLLHPPRYTLACSLALHRAVALAIEGWMPADVQAERRYLRDPSPAEFRQWADVALRADTLAFDIETNYHQRRQERSDSDLGLDKDNQIVRISFASAPGVAVSVPFTGQHLDIVAELLASPLAKVGWNSWQFDQPLLKVAGYPLAGVHYDGQDAWHLLQSDLPKGLEHVSAHYCPRQLPWKHLGGDPQQAAEYSCLDADLTWRIWQGIQADLQRTGQWDFYLDTVRLMPILREAGDRGICIDTAKQAALRETFTAELAGELRALQGEIPAGLVTPDLRTRPTPIEGWRWEPVESTTTVKACADCGKVRVNRKHACKVAPGLWRMTDVAVPATKYRAVLEDDASPTAVREWVKDWGFNPGSTPQLKAYALMRGHELGYNPKTHQDSLDTKQLERLARQHRDPIYTRTVTTKKISKALSTYVDSIVPRADGRVGTTYVNAPSTWRLASRNYNLQNQPKRGGNKWAKQARGMFLPSPGHVFVQADYSAIEAVLVGWFMGDADYIALAKRSIHAYVCALELGWVTDPSTFTPDMASTIKAQHGALYDRIKTVVHGSNYGMSPYLMWKSMETMFPTLALAQQSQDALFRALPGLKAWQFQVRAQAQKEAYLENPWQVRHYFYDVFTWASDAEGRLQYTREGDPKVKLGKDAKRATAFLPQSSAGCVMRETLALVGESWLRPYMPAAVSVHDSILLDVPAALEEAATAELTAIMTRPIARLNGLQIGIEVERGLDWLHMDKVAAVPLLDGHNGLVGAASPTTEAVA
jgi:DNA polymerase I-like protein with 3'-5' exonuclease and polymerase domains